MTRRQRLSERLSITPGTRRNITGDEFNEMQRQAVELESENDQLRGQLERRATAQLTVSEPPVYGPGGGGRYSWFRDMTAVHIPSSHIERDGGRAGAEKRLHAYAAYEHHQTERRLLAARHRAESLTEAAITTTRQETILYERWLRAGGQLFEHKHELDGVELERRALSRVQGDGGWFSPPGWLVDRFVHAPRAGAPFAALWTQLPMPPGVSSVNLPRLASGAGSGVQTADGASVPNRDPVDGTVKATLITIAAQIDVAVQWLDQVPIPPDSSLGADLAEDFLIQLDGQLLLGSGSSGQAQGVVSGGTFSASNMIWLQNTADEGGMSWTFAESTPGITGTMHTSAAQLRSKIRRYRGLAPTAWVVPPTVMDMISGQGTDLQERPLVPPGMGSPGDVPMLHWTPVVEDANIPLTFGGTTPPSIGLSSGITSPTDGTGTHAPMLLGRWSDCIFFQSEPVVRLMPDVLAGTLQVRFQVYTYIAAIPNRIQWAGGDVSFSSYFQGGGVNTGAAVSFGGLTQFTTNGIFQPAAQGF
jgi:HK97 family phage major capsid protein